MHSNTITPTHTCSHGHSCTFAHTFSVLQRSQTSPSCVQVRDGPANSVSSAQLLQSRSLLPGRATGLGRCQHCSHSQTHRKFLVLPKCLCSSFTCSSSEPNIHPETCSDGTCRSDAFSQRPLSDQEAEHFLNPRGPARLLPGVATLLASNSTD